MEQKIWATGDSKVGGYLKLAQNYRKKHGSLAGFLDAHGALIKDNGKTYKVRVDGERVKLASLSSYNAYQSLRQGKEGYNRVRKELLELGIPKEQVEAFIQDDAKQYKQVVSEVKGADAISAEPVQKGHVGSLQTGSPDVSGNIEPELRSVNTGKQGQSPLPEALLAEGRPRTSQEAFIRWKDSSGLPNPSDYTYEQRQALRAAQSVEEVDDLLTSFDKPKPGLSGTRGSISFSKNLGRADAAAQTAANLATGNVAGAAMSGGMLAAQEIAQSKTGQKAIAEILAKRAAKSGAKFVPGVDVAISAVEVIDYAKQGRFDQAGIAALSGLIGWVPVIGDASAAALDAGNTALDISRLDIPNNKPDIDGSGGTVRFKPRL